MSIAAGAVKKGPKLGFCLPAPSSALRTIAGSVRLPELIDFRIWRGRDARGTNS